MKRVIVLIVVFFLTGCSREYNNTFPTNCRMTFRDYGNNEFSYEKDKITRKFNLVYVNGFDPDNKECVPALDQYIRPRIRREKNILVMVGFTNNEMLSGEGKNWPKKAGILRKSLVYVYQYNGQTDKEVGYIPGE